MSAGKDSQPDMASKIEQGAASSQHRGPGENAFVLTPSIISEPMGPISSSPTSPRLPYQISIPEQATPPRRRRRRFLIAFIVLLLLILVGSGLGAFFLLNQSKPAAVPPVDTIVGQAFFVSSGQLSENGSQGINDELEINLHNIPGAGVGTSYFAWLLGDKNQPGMVPLLLGKLPIDHGTVHFLYPGTARHANLLAFTSRILITEEDATITPVNPSPDTSNWRYIAELPQQADPNDTLHHYSMLDHLRSLLAEDPVLASAGQYGGLNIWLQRNTGKILEWAGSARDYWDSKALVLMRAQFIRILDYLDGKNNVQLDVPPGTPVLASAPIALIGIGTSEGVSGSSDYLHEISGHLNAIVQAPGITPARRKLAAQINSAMNTIQNLFMQVRVDAKQLLSMSDAQLLSQSSLLILDDMETQAFYAYTGQIDPATNQLQSGVVQISYDMERLATLDLTPYVS